MGCKGVFLTQTCYQNWSETLKTGFVVTILTLILEEMIKDRPVRVSMDTEIWTWGLNAKGQLGLGDMIER